MSKEDELIKIALRTYDKFGEKIFEPNSNKNSSFEINQQEELILNEN